MVNNANNNKPVELHYGLPASEEKIRVEEGAFKAGVKTVGAVAATVVGGVVVGVPATVIGGLGHAIFSSERRKTPEKIANAWRSAYNGLFDKTFYDKRTVATDGPWAERSVRENPDNHLSPLGVMPGDEEGIKNLFETTTKTIYTDNTNSHVQYIINADEGRVYLKIAKDDGSFSYQSFKVVNPSSGDMIQETARLMKAAKTIAATLNDPKANGCFDKYDLVVLHIKYHDTQNSLVMRGFKYACWTKNEQTDKIEWDSTKPLWNVDPCSILYGAEITSEKALTKEIARIFGLDDKGKLQDDLRDRKAAAAGPGAAGGAAGAKGAAGAGAIPSAPPPYVPFGFKLIKVPTNNSDTDLVGAFVAQDMVQEQEYRSQILRQETIPFEFQEEFLARVELKKSEVADYMKERISRLLAQCDREDVRQYIADDISLMKSSLENELKRRLDTHGNALPHCERDVEKIQGMLAFIKKHDLTKPQKVEAIQQLTDGIIELFDNYAGFLEVPAVQEIDGLPNPSLNKALEFQQNVSHWLESDHENAPAIMKDLMITKLQRKIDSEITVRLAQANADENELETLRVLKQGILDLELETHDDLGIFAQTIQDLVATYVEFVDTSAKIPFGFHASALCQEYLIRMYDGSVLQYNCRQSADLVHRKTGVAAANSPIYLHYEKGSHYDLMVKVASPKGANTPPPANGPAPGTGPQAPQGGPGPDNNQGGGDRPNGRRIRSRSDGDFFNRGNRSNDTRTDRNDAPQPDDHGSFSDSSERQRKAAAAGQPWSENSQLQARLANQQTQIEGMTRDLAQARDALEGLEALKEDRARIGAELDKATQKEAALQKKLSKQKHLKGDLAAAKKRIGQQILELKAASELRGQLEKAYAQVQKQLGDKSSKIEQLTKELAQAREDRDATLRYAKQRVHDICVELQNSATKYKELQAQLLIEQEIHGINDQRVKELQQGLAQARKEHDKQLSLYHAAMQGWEATLQDLTAKKAELAQLAEQRDSFKAVATTNVQAVLEDLKSKQADQLQKLKELHEAKEAEQQAKFDLEKIQAEAKMLEANKGQEKAAVIAVEDVDAKAAALVAATAEREAAIQAKQEVDAEVKALREELASIKAEAAAQKQELSTKIGQLSADLMKAQFAAERAKGEVQLQQEKTASAQERAQLELIMAQATQDRQQLELQQAIKAQKDAEAQLATLQARIVEAEKSFKQQKADNKEQIREIIKETRAEAAEKTKSLEEAIAARQSAERQKIGADLAIQELRKQLADLKAKPVKAAPSRNLEAEITRLEAALKEEKMAHARDNYQHTQKINQLEERLEHEKTAFDSRIQEQATNHLQRMAELRKETSVLAQEKHSVLGKVATRQQERANEARQEAEALVQK
jgi:hypothetical protein